MFMATPHIETIPMRRSLRRDNAGLSNLVTLLLAAVLILAGVALYVNTLGKPPALLPPPPTVERGDQAVVDYIGYFEDGTGVFDTSILAIALDNATWPKAITFTWKGDWSPLGPLSVGNRSVIAGFDDGLLGMAQGQTKTIVVPPELGYGRADPALFVRRPLVQDVPIREEMSESTFRNRFAVPPVDGGSVPDPFWNWTVLVHVAGNVVNITHSPAVGAMIRPYGAWSARVESIDDTANGGVGIIRVHHLLTSNDVGRALVRDGSRRFAVAGVDVAAGSYVADYNFPPQGGGFIWIGKVMVFQVTVTTLLKA